MKRIYGLWASIGLFTLAGNAQTINLQQVVTSGITDPIGVYFAPGNDTTLFILEQGGIIKLANAGTGLVSGTPFLNITSKVTSSGNEQGLLGLAFDPEYISNGYFYVNYTRAGNGATVVSRFKRSAGNAFVADGASEDIVIQIAQPFSNHNGGQLQFGRDGYLYVGMGDGGSANDPQGNGQNGNALLGKMLRLDVAVDSGYAVPADNPFVNDANVRDEIWALGVRNPWRFSFDQKTADMWIADVGQNVWEEIDFEPAGTGGLNYGWRCYEGNVAFNTAGCQPQSSYTAPVAVYNHSGGNCSVTGGFVYRGGLYAELYGKYIYTDYCTGTFRLTYPDGLGGWITETVSTTPTLTFQISSFGQDQHGEIYVVSRDGDRIYRVVGTLCAPADIYSTAGGLESCTGSIELMAPYGPDNTYAWYRNDTLLSETSNILNTTVSGIYSVEVENSTNACGNEAVAEVIVGTYTPVEVSLPVTELCEDAAPVTITVDTAGGVLSGLGVSGTTFNPDGLSGTQNVIYSFTNTDGCTSHDTAAVTVHPLPEVSLTVHMGMNGFCLNNIDVMTGTPAGGIFSGPGVSGDSLYAGMAGAGEHTVYYTYTDGEGCIGIDSFEVRVYDCYTGIEEVETIALSMYPNPSTGYFTIKAGLPIANVSVFSPTGGHLRQTMYSQAGVGSELVLDMTEFSSGIYLIEITFENGQRTDHRIILQKPWEKSLSGQ